MSSVYTYGFPINNSVYGFCDVSCGVWRWGCGGGCVEVGMWRWVCGGRKVWMWRCRCVEVGRCGCGGVGVWR